MKSVLVLVNGLNCPEHVLDYAITQAREHSASLHLLFLAPPAPKSQLALLPAAVTPVVDKIISKAESAGVFCTTERRIAPSLPAILRVVKSHDLVCLDAAYDTDLHSSTVNRSFTAKELVARTTAPVKLVRELTPTKRNWLSKTK